MLVDCELLFDFCVLCVVGVLEFNYVFVDFVFDVDGWLCSWLCDLVIGLGLVLW